MRQELAIVISPLIALIVSGPIVLFGDERAQYGLALILVGLVPLLGSVLMVPVHLALVKLKRVTFLVYAVVGTVMGALCGALIFLAGGGVVASIFSFFWPCISFIVFRSLINSESIRCHATT